MPTVKRIFNPTAWRQWLVVFLAGLVVLTTTACGTTQAAVPPSNGSGTINPGQSENMYPHKDTDMDTRAADAKADRMIREADQRIEKNIDKPLGQRAEEIGKSAKQAAENIGQSTQRAADNAADNARGLVNGAANRID